MAYRYVFSIASMAALAVAAPMDLFTRDGPTCPSGASAPLSCHATTTPSNLCCYNSPGGQLLQTQFWDTNPATGPSNAWTVHGLWPDNCDGTYQQFCDKSRESTDITGVMNQFGKTELLSFMQTYWKDYQGNDETFWEHEWNKHGTCISTFDSSCYANYQAGQDIVDFFQKTVDLYKTLNTYEILAAAGITPSEDQTYNLADIQAAITKAHGKPATVNCKNGEFNEIWYQFNVRGSAQAGAYVASDPIGSKSTCPSSGIKYLPKSGSPAPTGSDPEPTTPAPTPAPTQGSGGNGTQPVPTPAPQPGTGAAFSGRGYLNVASGGCLISTGKWLVGGTCATYTATPVSSSTFTLKSSKGACGLASGVFTCGSGVSSTTFSASSSGKLTFSADSKASGSTQQAVYGTSGHSVAVSVSFGASSVSRFLFE